MTISGWHRRTGRPERARRRNSAHTATRRFRRLQAERLEPRLVLATVAWDGGPSGAATNWAHASNWVGDALPGPNDDVQIDPSFSGVTLASGGTVSIKSLSSAAKLRITGGTFSIAGNSTLNGGLTLDSGTLTVSGALTVSGGASGGLTISEGNLKASGAASISPLLYWYGGGDIEGARQSIDVFGEMKLRWGGGKYPTIRNCTLVNWGEATATGVDLFFDGQAVLKNQAGATFDIQSNLRMSPAVWNAQGTFQNEGTLRRSNGSTSTWTAAIEFPFHNSGTVQVDKGELVLAGGGTSGGTFNVASEGVLSFGWYANANNAAHFLTASSVLRGDGNVDFYRGTVNISGTYDISGKTSFNGASARFLSGANLANLGSSQKFYSGLIEFSTGNPILLPAWPNPNVLLSGSDNVIISGSTVWGRSMRGTGQTIAMGGIQIPATGGYRSALSDGRTLANVATATWTGNDIEVGSGSVLLNQPGALFEIQCDASVYSGGGTFRNKGTVRKSAGAGTTSIWVPFENEGALDVQMGAIDFYDSLLLNDQGTLLGQSFATVTLRKDLLGTTRNAEGFASEGALRLEGAGSAGSPQRLEVMGQDRGNTPAGFQSNFVYADLSVGDGTYVRLVDTADNSDGAGPEALYVKSLTVVPGGILNLNGLHVYAQTAQVEEGSVVGGEIQILPDGGPISLGQTVRGRIAQQGEVDEWTFSGRGGRSVSVVLSVGAAGSIAVPSPALGYGRIRLLDPEDRVVAEVASLAVGADATLAAVQLPGDGTYRIQVLAAEDHPLSTGNYGLKVADATLAGVSPRVAAHAPGGDVGGTIASVDVWFNETIDRATLTTDDVAISRPDATSLAVDAVEPVGFNRFRIYFAPQTALGVYHVLVGPDIRDPEGNALNQDGDGAVGEPGDDVYDAAFHLSQVDLAITSVALGSAELVAGELLTVSWEAMNQDVKALQGAWTDAVYLSTDASWDVDDIWLTSLGRSGGLPEGQTYQGSVVVEVPGALPGEYHVIVRADVRSEAWESDEGNNSHASAPLPLRIVELPTDGTPITGEVLANRYAHYYAFEVPAGEGVRVEVDAQGYQGTSEIYASGNAIPSQEQHDFQAVAVGSRQVLVLPGGSGGTTFFVMIGRDDVQSAMQYQVVAQRYPIVIAGVNPNRLGGSGPTTVLLTGAGFDADTSVEFVGSTGTTFTPAEIRYASDSLLRLTLDLSSWPTGLYDVRVARQGEWGEDYTYELADAFTVVEGAARLHVDLTMPQPLAVLMPIRQTLWVRYDNTGQNAMRAPLLMVQGQYGARLALDSARAIPRPRFGPIPGLSDTVQFLALGSSESPWILQPGESREVPVYCVGVSERPSGAEIGFSLTSFTTDDSRAIEWSEQEPLLRPAGMDDETWAAEFPRIQAWFGPTWGGYVRRLNEAEELYMALTGTPTQDVGELVQLSLQQMDASSVQASAPGGAARVGLAVPREPIERPGGVAAVASQLAQEVVAEDDPYLLARGGVLRVGKDRGLLANDKPEGEEHLRATVVSQPAGALVVMNPDGSFTLTPHLYEFAPYTFTYKVTHNITQQSDTAEVTVNICEASNPLDKIPNEIISPYGWRQYDKSRPHYGIDLQYAQGTHLGAIRYGTLWTATWTSLPDAKGGNQVVLENTVLGERWVYLHLDESTADYYGNTPTINVTEQGQPIAVSGSSGKKVQGPHLHLQEGRPGQLKPPLQLLSSSYIGEEPFQPTRIPGFDRALSANSVRLFLNVVAPTWDLKEVTIDLERGGGFVPWKRLGVGDNLEPKFPITPLYFLNHAAGNPPTWLVNCLLDELPSIAEGESFTFRITAWTYDGRISTPAILEYQWDERTIKPPPDPPQTYVPWSRSFDPNDKLGPAAFGYRGYVDGEGPLPYMIRFENKADATAPARQIVVTDTLDEDLDLATFELAEIRFVDQTVVVPPGLREYQTKVPFNAAGTQVVVDVRAALDVQSRRLELTLAALDPATGWFSDDPMVGLLYPNDDTGRGEGAISYLVAPKAGLPSGTEILNQARIVFDYNDPIDTPLVRHTLDAVSPQSNVLPLDPVASVTTFLVEWSGQDDPNGSGVDSYEVYVSDNGQPFTLWKTTADTSAFYPGEEGHAYEFYSVALDHVGRREAAPLSPDTQTTVVNVAPTVELTNTTTTLPEDINTASRIKVADIVITDDGLGTNLLSLSGADAALFEIDASVLYLKAGTALDYETNSVLDVTVEVNDPAVGTTPDDTASLAVSVTDITEATWHNTSNPFDVSGSGGVTAQDVLTIINWINAHQGDSSLPPPPAVPPPYYDVSGDGLCTANDVLRVVNYINSHLGLGGEGESIVVPDLPVTGVQYCDPRFFVVSLTSRLYAGGRDECQSASTLATGREPATLLLRVNGVRVSVSQLSDLRGGHYASRQAQCDERELALDKTVLALDEILLDIAVDVRDAWVADDSATDN